MPGYKLVIKILIVVCLAFFISKGDAMGQEKPWPDWPDTDIEAGGYVKENGIFQGFVDGTFRPHIPITSFQFGLVLDRAGIPKKDYKPTSSEVTIGETQKYLPNTAWSSKPEDKATRFRTAVMVYRYKNNISQPDDIIIDKLETWFQETRVTWKGVTRTPRLVGHAKTIVNCARKYNVPIWLALGQCWRESQWFTTGLSINYNCGWGIKDGLGKWGRLGNPPTIGGYANYISIDEAIEAYFKLMSSPDKPYRALIDKYLAELDQQKAWEYITQVLDIYAPSYENDTIEHHKIVRIVKGWCEERGIR